MIIDITSEFRSFFGEVAAYKPQPVPIEVELCMKQSADIETSLKKVSRLLDENRENYFSNAAYSYSAFTDQQRN